MQDGQQHSSQRLVGKMTVSEIDICRTANVLIHEHGDQAPIHAAMRHDALLEARDLDGCAASKRIIGAIDELLSKEPPAGTGVH